MDSKIKSLEPTAVWKHFAAICEIPHVSGNESEIRNYVIGIAKVNNLEYRTDGIGNLVVRKPASSGKESLRGVVLQSHLDMAAQKEPEYDFDFENDPIDAVIDGGWVKAQGTSLGADNSIGIATSLAILESSDIEHGPLEALFTVDEETSMAGAHGLAKDFLRGDILINLDLDTEGELCLGCAGGVEMTAKFKYIEDRNVYADRNAIRIEVRGLKGGHSGYDIGLPRANAIKLLFRFLYLGMKHFSLNINQIDAGGLLNAIPREATTIVSGPSEFKEDFLYGIEQYEKIIRDEYAGVEDGISIKGYVCDVPPVVWDRKTMTQVINAVCGCPNGVVRMSPQMPGLVRTSTNIGRVVSGSGDILVQSLLRSSSNTEREALVNDMTAVFELADAQISLTKAYDGWMYNLDSPIYKVMSEAYEKLYGKKPKMKAVHAALGCGIIRGSYPKLDMISCGPTIKGAHSANEKVHIDSVAKFWDLLKLTLSNIPSR